MMEYLVLLILAVLLVVLVLNARDLAAARADRRALLNTLQDLQQTPRDTRIIEGWFQRNDPHGYGRRR